MRDIYQVGKLIDDTIDLGHSKDAARTVVASGVDQELDQLKQEYRNIGHFIPHVTAQVARGIPEWARRHIQKCMFVPQLGFLVAVTLDVGTGRGEYDGPAGGHDVWEEIFTADGCAYYKNSTMRGLDARYGGLHTMIIGKLPSESSSR